MMLQSRLCAAFADVVNPVPYRGSLPWEYVASAALLRSLLPPSAVILKADAHDEHVNKPCWGGVAGVLGPEVVLLELDSIVAQVVAARGDFNVRTGSILEIPFPARTFHAVVDCSTLDHVGPDKVSTALSQYSAVLRSGGVLLLFVWESTRADDLMRSASDAMKPYGPNHQFYFEPGFIEGTLTRLGFDVLTRTCFEVAASGIEKNRQMTRFVCWRS